MASETITEVVEQPVSEVRPAEPAERAAEIPVLPDVNVLSNSSEVALSASEATLYPGPLNPASDHEIPAPIAPEKIHDAATVQMGEHEHEGSLLETNPTGAKVEAKVPLAIGLGEEGSKESDRIEAIEDVRSLTPLAVPVDQVVEETVEAIERENEV